MTRDCVLRLKNSDDGDLLVVYVGTDDGGNELTDDEVYVRGDDVGGPETASELVAKLRELADKLEAEVKANA